jgi:hypothetical protein
LVWMGELLDLAKVTGGGENLYLRLPSPTGTFYHSLPIICLYIVINAHTYSTYALLSIN